MKQKTFAVMGATGHIGHTVAEELLKRGHIVRSIGRNIEKLHQLELKKSHLVISEFDDLQLLTEAFKDTYAVFSFLPPSLQEKNYTAYQDRISETIAKAIADSGVQRVVNLSSIGAELPKGTGIITCLHRQEQRLNQIKNLTTLIHLRPTYFMENLTHFIPSILNQKIIESALEGNLPIPMIATRDIGWRAAELMDSTADHSDNIFDMEGPKNVTMNQVAELLSTYLEMPTLRYKMASNADVKKAILAAGMMSNEAVDLYIEMNQAFNSGLIKPTTEITQDHKGGTRVEEFLRHMAHRLYVPLS
jgi:uncharacterized protein YbjT (DUF2867 family)